jgi:isochorismate hydrolase
MKINDALIENLNSHDWTPKQGKTALLLIDMQEYFRMMISPILENVLTLLSAVREINLPVFFTQHGHPVGEKPNILGDWWSDIIMEGSQAAGLLPELAINSSDNIIAKDTYSSFYKTDLQEKLEQVGITDLIIGGVMTNLCCETTAREAFVQNYRVFFLADGTSTASEELHMATLKNLAFGFATLTTCSRAAGIISEWLI